MLAQVTSELLVSLEGHIKKRELNMLHIYTLSDGEFYAIYSVSSSNIDISTKDYSKLLTHFMDFKDAFAANIVVSFQLYFEVNRPIIINRVFSGDANTGDYDSDYNELIDTLFKALALSRSLSLDDKLVYDLYKASNDKHLVKRVDIVTTLKTLLEELSGGKLC